jgi:hypoxia up-regulated 1
MKKTKNDVFKNPRAMAKLFKEAGRVKNVLSANVDHFAQVENLIDEQDFRYQVSIFYHLGLFRQLYLYLKKTPLNR